MNKQIGNPTKTDKLKMRREAFLKILKHAKRDLKLDETERRLVNDLVATIIGNSYFVECNYCFGKAPLVDSAVIYGKSYGMVYYCKPCEAYVGVHKGSRDFKPLGFLANQYLRTLRRNAHTLFDQLWKNKAMLRPEAYKWLSEKMGMEVKKTHIGQFDTVQCVQVIGIMFEELGEERAKSLLSGMHINLSKKSVDKT